MFKINFQHYLLLPIFILIFNSYSFVANVFVSMDESYTYYHVVQSHIHGWSFLTADAHMILYDSLLYIFLLIFGFNFQLAKIFSVLISIITIIYTYKLIRYLLDQSIALVSVCLLACSPLFIYFSHQVRSYPLLLLLSVISTFYFLQWTNSFSKKNYLIYFVITVLLPFTHTLGLSLPIIQVIYVLFFIKKKQKITKSIAALCASIGIYSPYFLYFTYKMNFFNSIPKIYAWVETPKINVFWNWIDYFSSYSSLTLLNTVVFLFSIFIFFKKDHLVKNRLTIFYQMIWIFLPITLLYVFSYLYHPIFIERGYLTGYIAFLTLLSYSLFFIQKKYKYGWLFTIFFLLSNFYINEKIILKKQNYSLFSFKNINNKNFFSNHESKKITYYYPEQLFFQLVVFYYPNCLNTKRALKCLNSHNVFLFNPEKPTSYNLGNFQEISFIVQTKHTNIIDQIRNNLTNKHHKKEIFYDVIGKNIYFFSMK